MRFSWLNINQNKMAGEISQNITALRELMQHFFSVWFITPWLKMFHSFCKGIAIIVAIMKKYIFILNHENIQGGTRQNLTAVVFLSLKLSQQIFIIICICMSVCACGTFINCYIANYYMPYHTKCTTHFLTHWGRDQMDAISQTTFSRAFSSLKMAVFELNFHWNMFVRVQLTIIEHWFR